MNILEVKEVRKTFATQTAVDQMSFTLGEGSIFGLLGPNGAGKTTLIRMITGIFYPDSGSIFFQERPFAALKDSIHIGYMPEERGLYKRMKIGEQAIYLAQLKGMSRSEATRKVREWFARFDMQSWWNKKVEDLSKGMGQKLQFVTTVLHQPRLIILDEPFSGLDPVNANLIKEEIYSLAHQGATIVFSTHRMEQVEEICDHIILMNQGRKILDGTVAGVKQEFKENEFRIGLDNMPSSGLDTDLFEVVERQEGQLVVKIAGGHRPNDVLRFFIDRGIGITSFTEILPSLNDIFIKLVEGTPTARQFHSL